MAKEQKKKEKNKKNKNKKYSQKCSLCAGEVVYGCT